MHLTSISGMGFLGKFFFFAFALNTQNVNNLHKKNHKIQVLNERGEKKVWEK